MDWDVEGFPEYAGPNPGVIDFGSVSVQRNTVLVEGDFNISSLEIVIRDGTPFAALMDWSGNILEFSFATFRIGSTLTHRAINSRDRSCE